ncbi:MAG: polysaccharide biosynthesis protein [Clostridia bacterium]|nr:polysaccharide biosynthesis protein [Clostridia bacterium]
MVDVMYVASAGGHLSELLELEPLFKKHSKVIITEKTESTLKLKEKYDLKYVAYGSKQYMYKYIFIFPYNIIKAMYYILKYRPKVIITTGAHTGGIFVTVGKILGKKTIYIESMAKVDSLSQTGKFVYNKVDKFYVQWEDLCKKYDKCKYLGRLK